jgi:MoaA/NifB/PqqE/SkfB family radical SAM enzyme/SAM-dependent methyltransferase
MTYETHTEKSLRGDEFFTNVASRPPFTSLHPAVALFFKDYLSHEKAVTFQGRYVVNTHFPPFPSRAFDNLAAQFGALGDTAERALYSVTFAVTNRCGYKCWHCYNAGRSQNDLPLAKLREVARTLQELHAVRVTLSGGEPLLRSDLEDIAASFDDSTYLNLNTTGAGLTPERARSLRDSGVFACGVSIDSADPDEHDRLRGIPGAFTTALRGIDNAAQAGLYPYIVTVATHDMLKPGRIEEFLRFAGGIGAREVHLLEPCATGKLAGVRDALLDKREKEGIIECQKKTAGDMSLPILSSFLYLESPEAFGCGAGITHLYIDGAGEVCPCNLVPLSFGNVLNDPLKKILEKMGAYFRQPRACCVGHTLSEHIGGETLPVSYGESCAICDSYLPKEHAIPRFFTILSRSKGDDVGARELKKAYDAVHSDYDAYWVSEAGAPVDDLIVKLPLSGSEQVLEAGCGTGFATIRLARRLRSPEQLTAVDLSSGMLDQARARAAASGIEGIRFIEGDALGFMSGNGPFDLIFTSWVLGYIPLRAFFAAAFVSLGHSGRLVFIVHKEHSPREPLDIFSEIVSRDPSVLVKRVAFDFPRNDGYVRTLLEETGFDVDSLSEGGVTFTCKTPDDVLAHLLKSGAGTAYYEAVDPARRDEQEQEFVSMLKDRHPSGGPFPVTHEYVVCIAHKP